MLNSKFLRSGRKSPLWVAAFCFKHLKKAQVFESDISSSVDKILQDEMDVVSYRVLAYLLLGVVRIYSKKVEYLFHDCNAVLVKINKFVINTKDYANVETLQMSITIPERFELDAFDLDIIEDAGGGHIAPQEEITLKEVIRKTEGFGQFSSDKFEEFDFGENTSSSDHAVMKDVHLSHEMSLDFEVFPACSSINLPETTDMIHNSIFSQKDPNNFDTVLIVGVEKESVNLFGQDQQNNDDQTVQEIVPYENENQEESSRNYKEKYVDISRFSGREKEPVLSVEASNDSHQVDNEDIMAKETSSSLSQMHAEIIEVHEASNFQKGIERPQDEKSYREECVHHGKFSVAKESLEEIIEGSVEEHGRKGKLEFQEKVSFEDEKLSVVQPQSKDLDVTPQSKFQGGSIERLKSGATTPQFLLISTPAVRERTRLSRKRKCVFDEMIFLPNEALKKCIHDTSDLVSGRRKLRRTLLTVQGESPIYRLPHGFYESLLPCYSSELQFLFSKKKMKIPDSLQIVETVGKLDVSESQIVGSPEHIATAPQSPPWCPGSLVIEETPGVLNVSESQASGSLEQIATAPQTPPPCQKLTIRSIERLRRIEILNSDDLGPSSPHESLEREQSMERDEVLNLMEEEINSCETENPDLCENSYKVAGWSERTRKVASYLHRSFLHLRKQKRGDVVNFSQVLSGRVKKECARLFYEILVLSTTGYADVNQNNAYGDIAICKLSKLEQTF